MISFLDPARRSIAPMSLLSSWISVISSHRNERERQSILFLIPTESVVTKPLANHNPKIANAGKNVIETQPAVECQSSPEKSCRFNRSMQHHLS